MIKKIFAVLILFFLPFLTFAQLVVAPTLALTALAQNIAGPGITVSNVSYICGGNTTAISAAGTFTYTGINLGIANGIVLSTGKVADIPQSGANFASTSFNYTYSDPDLIAIEPNAINDVCLLKFDFVPICNSISITYVFGSEEYPTFECSSFNDAFGIFLTGPGYAGTNIATIPGNIPVSINNINDGAGSCGGVSHNAAYFHNNYTAPNAQIVFNGYTIPVTSTRTVTPCSTYTMKIAIADAADNIYDSGVFIKASSVGCTTPPVVSASSTANTCGSNNGTATATVTNYTGTTTYSWSPGGQTTASIGGLSAGTYTCVVGLSGPCSSPYTTTVTATVAATGTVPTVSITGNKNICSGSSTTLTGNGATTYSWSVGSTSSSISVSPSTGTTTYTLTGSNATCSATAVATVTVTATPTLTIGGTTNLCSGQSAVLTGATAANYTWSTGATTNTISVTPGVGSTSYTLTGANGTCTATAVKTVSVTATPTLTISGNINLCSGQSTVLTGATATNYTWSTGATTNTISVTPGLGSTSYTLTGANGTCTTTTVKTVSVTATPTVNISGAVPICSGQSIILTGATANTYTWSSGGITTNTISVNPNSTTTYTLTGANGTCTTTALATVSVTPTPTLTITGVAPICNGQSIVLTGATAGSYSWSSGGVTTNTISVNPTGNTTYTLTGTNGTCTASTVATVTVNSLPVIGSASVTPAPCGQNTGCINSVSVSGGTPAYQYSWDNGTTWSGSSTNCNIPSGTYTLEVKDANNCINTSTVTVSSLNGPPSPQVVPTATTVCLGDSVFLNINPTQAGTTYSWTDNSGTHAGVSDTIINASPAGIYTVSVSATDVNGCLSTPTTFTFNVNSVPTTSVSGTAHFCKNKTTVLNATPSGVGYSYQWTQNGSVVTGATASSYTANAAGNYGVIITDNTTGCKAASTGNYTVTIDSLPKIDTSNMVVTTSNCGQSTGSVINVTVTPSTNNGYSWTNSSGTVVSTNINLGGVPAGSYCLLVTTNPTNCRDSICGVTISSSSAPPSPTLSTPNNTYCQGQTIAPITVTGTGTFNWYSDPGLTTQIATGPTYTPTVAVTTTIYVTATNSGCQSISMPVVITINPNPGAPTLSAPSYTACQGQPVGPLTASGSGTIIWSTSPTMNPIVHTGSTYSPTGLPVSPPPTIYYVQDTLSNGCKSTSAAATITVTIYPNPSIIGTATIDSAKCGASNGDVLGLSATGGTPAYTYQWINASGSIIGSSANLSNVGPGTYSLVVTDSHQCRDTSNVGFTINGSGAVHAGFTPSVVAGQAPLNVVFTNTSSGASNYNWNFGTGGISTQTNPVYTYTSNGTYTVVLTASNAAGCLDTATAVIVVDAATSIVIPNIFSPNGDGINDEFIILCTGMRTLNCDIFNRWGQLVYTLTSPGQSWDGKLNNGNHATEGTYYFVLNATGYDGKTYNYQGPITLVK